MATSQNGYQVLETNRTTGSLPRLRKWVIPGTGRHLFARDGSAGFLLAHVALWFHENLEPIGAGTWDDWGWAVRPVRGQTSGYSNHASGTAIDVNATQHPRGVATRKTFSQAEVDEIHAQLKVYSGCIRWGGDYTGTPDGMHFEINKPLRDVEARARSLWATTDGQRVLAANPGAAEVIWDGKVPALPKKPDPVEKPTGDPVKKPPAAADRLGADWSYARPDPAAVKKAGIRGVVRYVSPNPAKNLSPDEQKAIHAAGLWISLVWEDYPKRAGEGEDAGMADAVSADAMATALGYPLAAAMFYAVDYDADPSKVLAYFRGIRTATLRPIGVYGSARVVEEVRAAGLADYAWQTVAWSTGKVSKRANWLQRNTHSVSIEGSKASDWDENLLIGGSVPVWWAGQGTPPLPDPVPVPAQLKVLQANVQQTDKASDVLALIDGLVREQRPDVVVWNELGRPVLRDAVRALPGYDCLIDSNVGISWLSSRLTASGQASTLVNKGVRGITENRVILTVDLTDIRTGRTYRQKGGHSVHHVEVGGLPRIRGQITGQNARARKYFETLAAEMAADKETGMAVVFAGDLNVDMLAEKALPPSKRCPWFPYTLFGQPLGRVRMPLKGTHGARAIDWFVVTGPVGIIAQNVLPHGTSDHNPISSLIEIS